MYFAARGAEARIKGLLAIPGHPDLNHAAKRLGVRKAALAQQVRQLEHAVGATLVDIAPGSCGITLTPAGERFAQEVVPVFVILDRRGNDARTAITPESGVPSTKCHGTGT